MLSRLMTRREQLLLLGLAVALLVGAVALFVHDGKGGHLAKEAGKEPEEKRPVSRGTAEVAPPSVMEPVSSSVTSPSLPQQTAVVSEVKPAESLPGPAVSSLSEKRVVTPGETQDKGAPVETSKVAVAVMGAVQQPGLYRVAADARLQELIDRAGGLVADADVSDINLAACVIDGTTLTVPMSNRRVAQEGKRLVARGGWNTPVYNPPQYTLSGWRQEGREHSASVPAVAPRRTVEQAPDAVAPVMEKSGGSGLINVNTASAETLETLPGIGPKLAQQIVMYRTQTPFTSVDDLNNVPGIGDKRLEAIRTLVTVK